SATWPGTDGSPLRCWSLSTKSTSRTRCPRHWSRPALDHSSAPTSPAARAARLRDEQPLVDAGTLAVWARRALLSDELDAGGGAGGRPGQHSASQGWATANAVEHVLNVAEDHLRGARDL